MIHRRLLRTMLLPIDLRFESTCVDSMVQFLNHKVGENIEDHEIWLSGQIADWDETETPSKEFIKLVKKLLEVGNEEYSAIIRGNYFKAHTELVTNQLVPSQLARSILSHLLLISRLADEEKMSCAQISKILDAMNPSAGFGRRSVEAILTKMKMAPSISIENISSLYELDKKLVPDLFGDATIDECAAAVANVAYRLGFKDNIEKHLSILLDEEQVDRYTPYVQILHYQCSILEYNDHHVKDFYEFSPRGKAALHLFDYYPDEMVNAQNPFLNNAKSVGQVDFSWAAAKKDGTFPGASALFSILDGLDEMGYAARQELALWIRCFIHRFMVSAEALEISLPEAIDEKDCLKLIGNIAVENTATRGIIEQRVVDSLSGLLHEVDDGWSARGIGDSVNASNLSKKKLGDCDYQHVDNKTAVAYEAHGGLLTQTYLNEHIKTLPKSAQPRISEWKTFSKASDWHVQVVFVAHEFNAEVPDDIEVDGVRCSISFMSYSELILQTAELPIGEAINQHLLSPLSSKNTPSFVRRKVLELLA